MTDTGWKHPTIVKQYGGGTRGVINKGTCYEFDDLDNIKKDDQSYTDQRPWEYNAVDSDHKSPYIYAYNYGFNIPNDATVTKIILFAWVSQLTHPKSYYEQYVLKRQLRYSASKFCNVKLKQGTSVTDSGVGNQMAEKCAVPMLPYKAWSTEETTTFSGTPSEWGLTGNVNGVINSGNFGVVVQFVGTVKNGWVNPAVAQLRMKIEYTLPKAATVPSSSFSKITVSYGGKVIEFDDSHTSKTVINLTRANYDNPAKITFTYYHEGAAGETPSITLESKTLSMGAKATAHKDNVDSKSKYTIPKLQCGLDEKTKAYAQNIFVFPGVNVGSQTVTYVYDNVKYIIRFDVADVLDGEDRGRFVDPCNVCVIQNCLFFRNYVYGVGGANCITSEYYNGNKNIFGTGVNANKADNVNNENGGRACPDTFWVGECHSDSDDCNGVHKLKRNST